MKLHYLFLISMIFCVTNSMPQVLDEAEIKMLYPANVRYETHVSDIIEFEELELDETEINTEELIPFWARVANKIVAPFFVWYAHFNKWWQARNRSALSMQSNHQKQMRN